MLKENFLSILEAILGKKYFIDFLGFSNPHISKRVKYFLTLFLPDILFANVCNDLFYKRRLLNFSSSTFEKTWVIPTTPTVPYGV
jgi:hypothetical protein